MVSWLLCSSPDRAVRVRAQCPGLGHCVAFFVKTKCVAFFIKTTLTASPDRAVRVRAQCPGLGHCVAFFVKTKCVAFFIKTTLTAPLSTDPGVSMVTGEFDGEFDAGGNPAFYPGGSRKNPSRFILKKRG